MKKHVLVICFLLTIVCLMEYSVELNAYTPYYTDVLSVGALNEDEIIIKDFFISPITQEEHCVDTFGNRVSCHEITNLQVGDILISKSSHTLGVRHGHAGIVIDPEKGLVLEALGYGSPSKLQPLSKWNDFPTVKVLRLKEMTPSLAEELLTIANASFMDIPYNIFTSQSDMTSTHCSDIVFKLYQELGYNLNSDGGYWVTPKDIANSPWLDVISSYGFAPDEVW